jgi:hypothetical protein
MSTEGSILDFERKSIKLNNFPKYYHFYRKFLWQGGILNKFNIKVLDIFGMKKNNPSTF